MIHRIKMDVFAIGETHAELFREAHQDRRLVRSDVTIIPIGLEGAADYYVERHTPDVIFVEEAGTDEELMRHLQALADVCERETKVVVVGHLNDITLYRTLIDQGVSEYLMPPLSTGDILDTIDKVLLDTESAKVGKVIAIYGARGGVGSSCLAQNLAWCLSQIKPDEVALIEADLAFGTSMLNYNIEQGQTILDALADPSRLDVVLMDKFMYKWEGGPMILPSLSSLDKVGRIPVESMEHILDIAKQMASCVIVDLPHLWSPWVERTLIDADEALIVATPDLTSFRNLRNIRDSIQKMRGEGAAMRILFNFVDAYPKTQLSPNDFKEELGLTSFATVPFDPTLFGMAANNGQMLQQADPHHRIVSLLQDVGCLLTGWENPYTHDESHSTLTDKVRALFHAPEPSLLTADEE